MLPCEGTYFLTAGIRGLTNEPDRAFCERLVREASVALIPLSVFFEDGTPDHLVRFAFCKRRAVIENALPCLEPLFRQSRKAKMIEPSTPILVGSGQFTQRTAREGRLADSLDPIAMLAKAAGLALADSGRSEALLHAIDTVAVVRFTADSPGDQGRLPKRMFRNPPASVARRLGASPRRTLYSATGGNTPQWLVNRTAEEIANGECEAALLVGAEYIATLDRSNQGRI